MCYNLILKSLYIGLRRIIILKKWKEGLKKEKFENREEREDI